jgi:DNA processing protein
VCVLACGVDVVYPKGHDALLRKVAADGVIVSEWPPGSAPFAHRFLTRNRLIAAFATGTVVVEAAARSGAKNTAGHALEIGRPLLVVPGPVTSAASTGCHQLLREGGRCVTDADEVVEELTGIGAAAPAAPRRGPDEARDVLPPLERRVLDAVPVHRPASVARIARTAGLEPTQVRRALAALELAELTEYGAGGHRLSAAERRRIQLRREVTGGSA